MHAIRGQMARYVEIEDARPDPGDTRRQVDLVNRVQARRRDDYGASARHRATGEPRARPTRDEWDAVGDGSADARLDLGGRAGKADDGGEAFVDDRRIAGVERGVDRRRVDVLGANRGDQSGAQTIVGGCVAVRARPKPADPHRRIVAHRVV